MTWITPDDVIEPDANGGKALTLLMWLNQCFEAMHLTYTQGRDALLPDGTRAMDLITPVGKRLAELAITDIQEMQRMSDQCVQLVNASLN
jgi:hypothetical protein